jgi:enoyl-CoA hydratase/carnithine racemase
MRTLETLYNVANRVATITLNRPDKLNAWTALMESEVRSHMENAEQDDEVRVIVLTGAGRGFCAGADMSLLSAVAKRGLDSRDLEDRGRKQVLPDGANRRGCAAPDFQKKYSYFPAIGKPVIAAINGPVVGLGLVITLYCELQLA